MSEIDELMAGLPGLWGDIYYREWTDPQDALAGYHGREEGTYKQICSLLMQGGYSSEHEALDEAFRRMNVVDGTELAAHLNVRSMSVGDIVVLRRDANAGSAYMCASVGWIALPPERNEIFKDTPQEVELT